MRSRIPLLALLWAGLATEAASGSPPPRQEDPARDPSYAFEGKVVSVSELGTFEGQVFLTESVDPRWVFEVEVSRALRGSLATKGKRLAFAIHSPAMFFRSDPILGRDFRFTGGLVQAPAGARHRLAARHPWPRRKHLH
ncbi:MAG TPA: hypothetical protein VEN81_11835 [Planctomycetota bacterium]|nr:hypothetical protein [Planctomycetota bacterium]